MQSTADLGKGRTYFWTGIPALSDQTSKVLDLNAFHVWTPSFADDPLMILCDLVHVIKRVLECTYLPEENSESARLDEGVAARLVFLDSIARRTRANDDY